MIDLDDYSWLTDRETAVWLQKLAHDSRPVHQQLTQLRKQLSTTRAQLLVQQTTLRRRAVSLSLKPLAKYLPDWDNAKWPSWPNGRRSQMMANKL